MATPFRITFYIEKVVLQSDTIDLNTDVETFIIKFDKEKYEKYLHHLRVLIVHYLNARLTLKP